MTPSSPRLSRRQFFTQMATGAKAAPLPLLYTPNDTFFHSMTTRLPRLNADYWSLTIGGLVKHPVTWSYDDLMALPMTEIEATLLCAANEPCGERIGHARWRGISLQTLLTDGQVQATEVMRTVASVNLEGSFTHITNQTATREEIIPLTGYYVRLEGADGHVTSISYPRLTDAVLAFEMNGQPLTPEQGFPARLIVPGVYDYKMPRWIERIELIHNLLVEREMNDRPYEGVIDTTAAITSHRPHETVGGSVALEGYAFAGDRVIASVEISVDGSVWMSIPFTPGPRSSWSRWSLDWQPSSAGEHAVAVRATDENGQVQAAAHTVALRVVV